MPIEIGHGVVLALEGDRPVGHQPLEDRDRLLETVDPHAGPVELDPGLLVVGGHPAGAEAQLEAPVREQVERRHLAGEHDRVLVVVGKDE